MPHENKLFLVGIGYRPLGPQEREFVLGAEVLLASTRLLGVFQRYAEYDAVKDRIKVIDKVPDTIAFIREWFSHSALRTPHSAMPSLVLLASGDPLFFGIGRRMIEEFGKERVHILPDLSSMQGAFARIGLPWDDAFFISLHGGPDAAKRRKLPYELSDVPLLVERHGKLGILTDRVNNPGVVARTLQSAIRNPQSAIVMHICEHLGYPDEKMTSGTPEEIASKTFADPNVVILQKQESGARSQEPGEGKEQATVLGLREDEISHSRGLITKDEVRAVAIHKLRLPARGVLWDIGAGSGSISIEAARLCPELRVFAVERDDAQIGHIRENSERFGTRNLDIVHGAAPGALVGLPDPDRVFIGGSGGEIDAIIKLAAERMRPGVIVVNAVTLETLNQAGEGLAAAGLSVEISEVSVSRSKTIAGRRQMSALNPVFIVSGGKS